MYKKASFTRRKWHLVVNLLIHFQEHLRNSKKKRCPEIVSLRDTYKKESWKILICKILIYQNFTLLYCLHQNRSFSVFFFFFRIPQEPSTWHADTLFQAGWCSCCGSHTLLGEFCAWILFILSGLAEDWKWRCVLSYLMSMYMTSYIHSENGGIK